MDREDQDAEPHEQELLDEALEETFPASDPVSMVLPHGREDGAPGR